MDSDNSQTLGQNDTGFSCDGSANTFRVMFKQPLEILPNVSYTACATLKVSLPDGFTTKHTCSITVWNTTFLTVCV